MIHRRIPQKIKIKLSSTFIKKSLCKYCLSEPVDYFCIKNDRLYKSPQLSFNNKRIYKINPTPYFYFIEKYKEVELQDFKFQLKINTFNIKAHRAKGVSNQNNFEEVVICKCGKTSWLFNYKSTCKRKEISSRQSNKFYDKTFTY